MSWAGTTFLARRLFKPVETSFTLYCTLVQAWCTNTIEYRLRQDRGYWLSNILFPGSSYRLCPGQKYHLITDMSKPGNISTLGSLLSRERSRGEAARKH